MKVFVLPKFDKGHLAPSELHDGKLDIEQRLSERECGFDVCFRLSLCNGAEIDGLLFGFYL
jgi:hypothetical protein